MKGLLNHRLIVIFFFFAFLASPVLAQKVATKDGKTVQIQKYRVTEEMVFYVNDVGREVAIRLKDIDLDRTAQLNARESTPLFLPGMPPVDKTVTQTPLGDVARTNAPGKRSAPKKHVFTDDDVAHIADAGQNTAQNRLVDFQGDMDAAEKIVGKWEDKTPRELSDEVAGQVQFPERDSWQRQIYEQKTKMVSAAQACLYDANRLANASTQEGRNAAHRALDPLMSAFRTEKYNFDQLVAEGIKKAGEWERLRR